MLSFSAAKNSQKIFGLLLLVISILSTPIASAQDPGTIYLEAYLQVEDAEKLEKESKFSEALRKYSDAKNILDNIARDHRGWRPEVLDYRRRKVNEAIDRCRKSVPKDERPNINNPEPNNPNNNAANILDQRDETIKKLEAAKQQLTENLQKTQADYNKAINDLKTSKEAQTSLANELALAQNKLETGGLGEDKEKTLREEIAHLQNDLAIVNESFVKAKKRNTELQAEIEKVKDSTDSIEAQKAELQIERQRIQELINGVTDDDLKKLLAENTTLKNELSDARTEVQRLSSEKERDAEEIASLKIRIKTVEDRLAAIQLENSEYQEKIVGLSEKLKSTENKLAKALESPDGRRSIAQEALNENKTLRSIVKRQIMQQAWRKQAKELVLAELTRQGVASRGLINQIEKLAGKGTILTEQEQALLRESLIGDLGEQSGLILVQGNEQEIKYPQMGDNNDGELSKVGLNENLTQYAAAIAYDFAKGDFEKCANEYSKILSLAPNNVYTIRNLGLANLRLGQREEAENLLKKAIEIQPNDGYSHFLLGVYYYRIGMDEEAIQSIDRGLAIAPDNAKAHHYLGAICIKQGLRDRAIKEFERVISIDPSFGDAYYNLAYLYATSNPKRLDLARDCYLRAQQNGTSADNAMDSALGS
ncbi:MAG: tetratricopeptide repeat protein [Verrucomicrobiota bacterium]|nr:tetratricopeptide repeat protein [Verrucomicrobiota bacterium]